MSSSQDAVECLKEAEHFRIPDQQYTREAGAAISSQAKTLSYSDLSMSS